MKEIQPCSLYLQLKRLPFKKDLFTCRGYISCSLKEKSQLRDTSKPKRPLTLSHTTLSRSLTSKVPYLAKKKGDPHSFQSPFKLIHFILFSSKKTPEWSLRGGWGGICEIKVERTLRITQLKKPFHSWKSSTISPPKGCCPPGVISALPHRTASRTPGKFLMLFPRWP